MSVNSNNQAFKLENLFSVKDKVALITGGGTGIGLMATQALATNGEFLLLFIPYMYSYL
jgi:hypothetical protein